MAYQEEEQVFELHSFSDNLKMQQLEKFKTFVFYFDDLDSTKYQKITEFGAKIKKNLSLEITHFISNQNEIIEFTRVMNKLVWSEEKLVTVLNKLEIIREQNKENRMKLAPPIKRDPRVDPLKESRKSNKLLQLLSMEKTGGTRKEFTLPFIQILETSNQYKPILEYQGKLQSSIIYSRKDKPSAFSLEKQINLKESISSKTNSTVNSCMTTSTAKSVKRKTVGGYCENCNVKYSCLKKHLESFKHQKLTKSNLFQSVDVFISKLNQNRKNLEKKSIENIDFKEMDGLNSFKERESMDILEQKKLQTMVGKETVDFVMSETLDNGEKMVRVNVNDKNLDIPMVSEIIGGQDNTEMDKMIGESNTEDCLNNSEKGEESNLAEAVMDKDMEIVYSDIKKHDSVGKTSGSKDNTHEELFQSQDTPEKQQEIQSTDIPIFNKDATVDEKNEEILPIEVKCEKLKEKGFVIKIPNIRYVPRTLESKTTETKTLDQDEFKECQQEIKDEVVGKLEADRVVNKEVTNKADIEHTIVPGFEEGNSVENSSAIEIIVETQTECEERKLDCDTDQAHMNDCQVQSTCDIVENDGQDLNITSFKSTFDNMTDCLTSYFTAGKDVDMQSTKSQSEMDIEILQHSSVGLEDGELIEELEEGELFEKDLKCESIQQLESVGKQIDTIPNEEKVKIDRKDANVDIQENVANSSVLYHVIDDDQVASEKQELPGQSADQCKNIEYVESFDDALVYNQNNAELPSYTSTASQFPQFSFDLPNEVFIDDTAKAAPRVLFPESINYFETETFKASTEYKQDLSDKTIDDIIDSGIELLKYGKSITNTQTTQYGRCELVYNSPAKDNIIFGRNDSNQKKSKDTNTCELLGFTTPTKHSRQSSDSGDSDSLVKYTSSNIRNNCKNDQNGVQIVSDVDRNSAYPQKKFDSTDRLLQELGLTGDSSLSQLSSEDMDFFQIDDLQNEQGAGNLASSYDLSSSFKDLDVFPEKPSIYASTKYDSPQRKNDNPLVYSTFSSPTKSENPLIGSSMQSGPIRQELISIDIPSHEYESAREQQYIPNPYHRSNSKYSTHVFRMERNTQRYSPYFNRYNSPKSERVVDLDINGVPLVRPVRKTRNK
ncbi:hypothetical protein HDV04_001998 [Boothiomyces sp. JEL0838]|nr:hypothetical protein HDV04_001998 [Boothiomyces sp. JEL0838]